MAMKTPLSDHAQPADIKRMPHERAERDAIRQLAAAGAQQRPASSLPTRETLEEQAGAILAQLHYPPAYLGFAMVAVSNAHWRARFAAAPFTRRLLLLPHCLSVRETCAGNYDSVGLHCAGCGSCRILDLQQIAESLGYQVIVAEGTSSVLMKVIDGDADAILGVACLDSLEKSFARIAELGIPHLAVPLLHDGCTETETEVDQVMAYLHMQGGPVEARGNSYLPLLRETRRIFAPDALTALLAPYLAADMVDTLTATEAIAADWLREGGKRLRPFVTVAAYALAHHGLDALATETAVDTLVPPAVKRVAVAIEAMHKASLVHDDIEDDDAVRYGLPTLHRQYGTAPAINIGDFLVGLGYRLIAGESASLGATCVADILARLSAAHLDLCRGQGAELLWQQRQTGQPRPIDALSIYALKTSPAFEAALYAGLRAANVTIDDALLKRFAIYLGEAFQVRNDLEDWDKQAEHARLLGRDVLAGRPTILRAFAIQAGGGAVLEQVADREPEAAVAAVGAMYAELGVFTQAEKLLAKLRARALGLAEEIEQPSLRDLFGFLVRIVLPDNAHGSPAP